MKSISISKFQDNPGSYIHECKNDLIELTKHGQPVAYVVPPQMVNITSSFSLSAQSVDSGIIGVAKNQTEQEVKQDEEEHKHDMD